MMKLNQKHAHSFGLPHRRQAGASLIELLVSILVFAVGVAGVASLQILSLRDSFDNSQRSHVVTKAQELIDRVRANPDALDDYLAAFSGGLTCSSATPPKTVCGQSSTAGAAQCSAAEMAEFDSWDMFCGTTRIDDSLIELEVDMECDDRDTTDADPCSPASDIDLAFVWVSRAVSTLDGADTTSTGGPAEQSYRLVFRP